MRIVAAIQVRMGSSRLPGKTLLPISGRPLLGHLLDRLRRCHRLDGIVVATSRLPENDAIDDFCRDEGVPCFRGSEDDLLERTLGALQSQEADVGVVAFGDGPLIDPQLVDQVIREYLDTVESFDFVSNDLKTSYPPGMEVEVFAVSALVDAAARAEDPAVREHGTLYIRQNPDRYRLRNVEAPPELRRPDLEMEVDTEEDVQVISRILDHFRDRPEFGLSDIISFLDANPALAAINRDVPRHWKEFREAAGGNS